jgi:hypothetical protein
MLAPGDVLHLPDPVETRRTLRAQSTNRYKAHVPTVTVRMRLHEGAGTVSNEPYRIEGITPPMEGTTDVDGNLSLELPATMGEVVVTFTQRDQQLVVMLGHLDPLETDDGLVGRLTNLGFLPSHPAPRPPSADARRAEIAEAVCRFQRSRDLPITGEIDDATRDALRESQGA